MESTSVERISSKITSNTFTTDIHVYSVVGTAVMFRATVALRWCSVKCRVGKVEIQRVWGE